MEIYRRFPNAIINGFVVVARCQDMTANAKLMYGGISKDHLMIVVNCNSNVRCQIGLVVWTNQENPVVCTNKENPEVCTNKENPEVVSAEPSEPWLYRMYRKWIGYGMTNACMKQKLEI
jgi:hypothetical protein